MYLNALNKVLAKSLQ